MNGRALDALRRAAQGADAEQKERAEALVRAIEKREEEGRPLEPRRVRLAFKGTPVAEAVAEFQRQSGYDLTVSDPRARLGDRRVTLDTGDVTFWQAVDRLGSAAGPSVPTNRPGAKVVRIARRFQVPTNGSGRIPRNRNETMNRLILAAAVAAIVALPASAAKPVPNRAYVQSGPDGVFYARCIPDADTGPSGTTKVYRVGKEKDELLDTYDWFAPGGVVLGWSPTAGKVAVMARSGKEVVMAGSGRPRPPTPQVELIFHLGGKLLASYTAEDLANLGVDVTKRSSDPARVELELVGCEQVPGTNDYLFVIEARGTKRLSFDILTGKPPTK